MEKKMINYIYISIALTIIFFIGGFVTFAYAETDLNLVSKLLSIILCFFGILVEVNFYKSPYFTSFLPTAFFAFTFAIIFFAFPESDDILLPIFAGTWMVVYSAFHVQMSIDLKRTNNQNWKFWLIHASLGMLLGICCMFDIGFLHLPLMKRFGIYVIAYSINHNIDLICYLKNINILSNYIVKLLNKH